MSPKAHENSNGKLFFILDSFPPINSQFSIRCDKMQRLKREKIKIEFHSICSCHSLSIFKRLITPICVENHSINTFMLNNAQCMYVSAF